MKRPARPETRKAPRAGELPSYVRHASFTRPSAVAKYDPAGLLATAADYDDRYMPDDVTRDHSRRMHHAAHRLHRAATRAERRKWFRLYVALRDRIVLGNRKLIYRAVRRRMAATNGSDDLIGDCYVVLIRAVAAFNPWLGIRFSTYAYTCLLRAMARSAQRHAADRLARAVPLASLPDGEPGGRFHPDPAAGGTIRIDEFLRDDHPLLTSREKVVLTRRFNLTDRAGSPTLATLGAEMGLSKERIRQVQAAALDKLRKALLGPADPAE